MIQESRLHETVSRKFLLRVELSCKSDKLENLNEFAIIKKNYGKYQYDCKIKYNTYSNETVTKQRSL
jgi:hypothetical protein